MPDARILWTGAFGSSASNQIDLTIPPQSCSEHALLLWGAGGHNASQGVGRFARFVDAGAVNWGNTAEIVVGDWPHTPFGAYPIYYRKDCGVGLAQGGTVSVNFGGSGGAMSLHLTACVVDPGVPVEVRAVGDQTGTVSEATATITLPGVRGYGNELEVMLIAAKHHNADLGTLPADWAEDAEFSDSTATVHSWIVDNAPTTRDVDGGRTVAFPWTTPATHWAAGTVIFTEVYPAADRAPCGFASDDWGGSGGGNIDDALDRAVLDSTGGSDPEVAALAPWSAQAVTTPAEERGVVWRVFWPEWPALGSGDVLEWRLDHPETGAYIRLSWDGGATLAVEERTPYGLVVARGTEVWSADARWWLFESTVNATGNTWTNRMGADFDGVALAVAAPNWDADGATSNTGSEARKWLTQAEPSFRIVNASGASMTARAGYWGGCGPSLGVLCQDFEDEGVHDDVFQYFGGARSAAGGVLVADEGDISTHLGDVVGYPLPFGFEIAQWPVPHASFPNAWSVEMLAEARTDGATGQVYYATLIVDADEIYIEAWTGPGFTTLYSSNPLGAPDKAALRFWNLRETGAGVVLETSPTASGPWTARLTIPGATANPDGYQFGIFASAFQNPGFTGGGFAIETIGCFAAVRGAVWVALV